MNVWPLLIFLMALGVWQISFVEGTRSVARNCLRKMGLTQAQVNTRCSDYNRSRKIKCFYNCYLYRMVIIENQKIYPDGFRNAYKWKLSSKAIDKVESRCHSGQIVRNPNKGRCDFGFRLFLCYQSLRDSVMGGMEIIPF